jgi:nucleotide-binding universal stress UspA family protein
MEFRSVVCGVDPSPAGQVAADRAARLVTPAGNLMLVGVDELTVVGGGGVGTAAVVVKNQGGARKAVDQALEHVGALHPNVTTHTTEGAPVRVLLDTVEARGADLLVVGTHETGRVAGVLLGSTATLVLHDAPCSVLVARDGADGDWPLSITVAVDGSDHAPAIHAAAAGLAERFGVPLQAVIATKGVPAERLAAAHQAIPGLEELHTEPVDALIAASATADLLVVGSRGLRGLKAIGSVSERVAHEALGSVLVLRT